MKIETHILYFMDRREAERIAGSVFGSMEEVKQQLANDGVELAMSSQHLHEFTEGWNNNDCDNKEMELNLDEYFISYIYITK